MIPKKQIAIIESSRAGWRFDTADRGVSSCCCYTPMTLSHFETFPAYPNLQFVALRSKNLSGLPTRQSLVCYWPGQLFTSFFMGTDQQGNSVNRPVACGVQKPSLGIDQFHGMDVCISAICHQSRFNDVWLRRYCTKILVTSHGYEQRKVEHATRHDC